jgi:hypothetical protein
MRQRILIVGGARTLMLGEALLGHHKHHEIVSLDLAITKEKAVLDIMAIMIITGTMW